jgi:hypothetical protein
MKVIREGILNISVMVAMAMITCLLAAPSAVWAIDDSSPPVMTQSRIDAATQKVLTISQKTPVDILANKGRFFVTPTTVIVDEDGVPIALKDFLVPCKAVVYYESKKMRDSKAVKIEVKEVLLGASKAWTPGAPE